MHFSHIYEGRPYNMLPEAYVQSLLAAVLDYVDTPLPPPPYPVGALYAAYTLYETQPAAAGRDPDSGSGLGHVVVLYVPPSRLRAMGRLAAAAAAAGARDATAVVRRLIRRGALAVGAVRRPPCSLYLLDASLDGGRPASAPLDSAEAASESAAAIALLRATAVQLRELTHVQLLADSYRSAQRAAFAGTAAPPAIVDLEMGTRLGRQAADLAAAVELSLAARRTRAQARERGLRGIPGKLGTCASPGEKASQEARVDISLPCDAHGCDPTEGRAALAGAAELPLWGVRVMLTAPRQYAARLSARLVDAGARPVWVPAIQVTRLRDPDALEELDAALADLGAFSDIAFTLRNGVEAVLERLAKQGAAPAASLARLKVWALGADAGALAAAGVAGICTPDEASTQGLKQALTARGRAGVRVLCPVPAVGGGLVEPLVVPRFLAALEAAGAHPTRVACYVTEPGALAEECAAELELLRSGRIHALALTSTAEAQALAALAGGAQELRYWLHRWNVLLAAHGPYYAAGAREVFGVEVPCVSATFGSFAGLVAALDANFS
ncbi:hypothetical protein WJX81_006417 [Elliptochloris bilobata]|uniref:Tetrapyrrole biosynthesis uroporphyrinogen III synthase domain-containing protein n=1 Tax=Elliptochloris bilobata TaxID=381761 RepID=A0AAW1SI02_9CHLO